MESLLIIECLQRRKSYDSVGGEPGFDGVRIIVPSIRSPLTQTPTQLNFRTVNEDTWRLQTSLQFIDAHKLIYCINQCQCSLCKLWSRPVPRRAWSVRRFWGSRQWRRGSVGWGRSTWSASRRRYSRVPHDWDYFESQRLGPGKNCTCCSSQCFGAQIRGWVGSRAVLGSRIIEIYLNPAPLQAFTT